MRAFKWRRIANVALGALMLWVLVGWIAVQGTDTLSYRAVQTLDGFEVREYDDMVVAQTSISALTGVAFDAGTARLSAYLRGDNTIQESVAMKRPSGIQPGPTSMRITPFAPLMVQSRGESLFLAAVTPIAYTIVTLPRPNNPEVRILILPKSTRAVRGWHGGYTPERAQREEATLRELLASDKRVIVSSASVITYGPSWAPPFLRRTEVTIPVRAQR